MKAILFRGSLSGGNFNICANDETRIIEIARWIASVCGQRSAPGYEVAEKHCPHPISNARAGKVSDFIRGNMQKRLIEMIEAVKTAGCES